MEISGNGGPNQTGQTGQFLREIGGGFIDDSFIYLFIFKEQQRDKLVASEANGILKKVCLYYVFLSKQKK